MNELLIVHPLQYQPSSFFAAAPPLSPFRSSAPPPWRASSAFSLCAPPYTRQTCPSVTHLALTLADQWEEDVAAADEHLRRSSYAKLTREQRAVYRILGNADRSDGAILTRMWHEVEAEPAQLINAPFWAVDGNGGGAAAGSNANANANASANANGGGVSVPPPSAATSQRYGHHTFAPTRSPLTLLSPQPVPSGRQFHSAATPHQTRRRRRRPLVFIDGTVVGVEFGIVVGSAGGGGSARRTGDGV